jgi:hypothetical protein
VPLVSDLTPWPVKTRRNRPSDPLGFVPRTPHGGTNSRETAGIQRYLGRKRLDPGTVSRPINARKRGTFRYGSHGASGWSPHP